MLSIVVFVLLGQLLAGPPADPLPRVAGTYDTRVTLLRSNCPMTVENNPTEVAQFDSTVITLRHAGTTYEGTLRPDGTFTTVLKTLTFERVTYRIGITGRFQGDELTAEVTLRYGEPACESVVAWAGPKRR